MDGFWDEKEFESRNVVGGVRLSCQKCGLYKYALNPKIPPCGDFKKKVMFLGEGPGEAEDRRNAPWQGKVGRRLEKKTDKFGISLFDDGISDNAVDCRPPKNETPSSFQIACCRQRVFETIEQYQPNLIVALGNPAMESLYGHRWKKAKLPGINALRGYIIPDQELNAWVAPVYHPSYIERTMKKNPAVEVIWDRDMQRALSYIDQPFPDYCEPLDKCLDKIEILEGDNEINDFLSAFRINPAEKQFYSIDFETTGLKPHAEGHEIVSVGIAVSPNKAYSFLMPRNKKRVRQLKRLLRADHLGWYGHNIKFEQAWLEEILGISKINWAWDSMMAAKLLRNIEPRLLSLKMQALLNFGIPDYASEVEGYLKGEDEKNANSFNKCKELAEENPRMLLLYGGLDALFTYRLVVPQKWEIGDLF